MAGRMGMSEREFRQTSPRYFYFRSKGFESVMLEQARNTRLLAFYSFLPHTKKNSVKRPEDLYHLPGDTKGTQVMTDEQRAHMVKVLNIAKTVDVFAGETMPKTIPEA